MQTVTLNNQSLITITDAATALGVTRQRIDQLCKVYHINRIAINKKCIAIEIVDFDRLKEMDRQPGRPWNKKSEK